MIAVVDYGLGNLFSVKHALKAAGAESEVTSSAPDIMKAEAVVLPGVGAFGDAMGALKRLDLIAPLRDFLDTGRPIIGICLGMQLLMAESHEFGRNEGLGFIRGKVMRFDAPKDGKDILKVPEVGWNRIRFAPGPVPGTAEVYKGVGDGAYMYFVHSYYVLPDDTAATMTFTCYGDIEYCSSIRCGNIIAFQFHPERSGNDGLRIYKNIMSLVQKKGKRT